MRKGMTADANDAETRRCLSLLEQWAYEGLGTKDAARLLRVSTAAVTRLLNRYGRREVRSTLAANTRRKRAHSEEEVIRRLRLVAGGRIDGKSNRAIAADIGISPPALTRFLTNYAPWGVEDALELYVSYDDMDVEEV